jgi:hypothetical protein
MVYFRFGGKMTQVLLKSQRSTRKSETMNKTKNALTNSPLRNLRARLRALLNWAPYQMVSFSQEGEDLILSRILEDKKDSGFYVDVGAHHPQRFSNTYMFYLRGWKGINIDAMPGSMVPFKKIRPLDINLELPVMKEKGKLTYYQFNEPALNGFSKELSESRNGKGGYQIIGTLEIEGATLSEILNAHVPKGVAIDFMSVDAEGLDLAILQSNDWRKYRPKVILVEILTSSLATVHSNESYQFIVGKGYQIFAKALNTVFFISEEFLMERNRAYL